MKKKGFTLIELMGIIAVIAVLILVASPTVIQVVKNSRVKLKNKNINTIVNAARQWVASNAGSQYIPDSIGEYYCMNLSTLKQTEFFEDVDIVDPTDPSNTSKYLDGSIMIRYNANKKQNDIEFKEGILCDITGPNSEGPHVHYQDASGANAPILSDNMIPVKYVSNQAKVANREENWYDYQTSTWANVVVVKSDKYNQYINAEDGTNINTADIIGYFVWIPRFKYQIWNNDASSKIPQTINIEFESDTNVTGNGYENGEWLTHPAFCMGTTKDSSRKICSGEEIYGLWVGKFETSGSITDPKILPNVTALTSQTLAQQIETATNFTSKYNLLSETDSHVMRNSEWGAVSYLSHSIYGKYASYTNTEVAINSTAKTGVITQVAQSTTNNNYGVYDMNGGKKERVASNVLTASKTFNKASSNITTTLSTRYFDKYTNITDSTKHTNGNLGDATKEIAVSGEDTGWYGDKAISATASTPFYVRGGLSSDSTKAGLFAFEADNGSANSSISFRITLVGK